MIIEPSGHWNVFKQIFIDHWDGFKQVNPRYHTRYYDGLVEKMLNCGNADRMGYIEYRCQHCGEGTHRVAMTCKSSFCLRCAKVYVDDWVSQVSRMLHEGVIYRHIVLTMPEMLRPTFYRRSQDLLRPLMRCGVKCLDDFYSRVSGKPLQGGYIVVIQTHGRSGQYNPHLHIIATSGGWDKQAEQWVHLDYLPYAMLRKKWQWHLLTMLRQTLKNKEINRLVDACYTRYGNGFVTNVQKGDVPSRYESLARYLAKYVVSPPISLRRIDYYNGESVGYHYRSHHTERVERERLNVYTFIGRMIQHVFPKGFKRIRYYGVQATKTFEKVKGLIQEALAKVKGVVKGAIKIIPALTYRQRYEQSLGRDPLVCKHCQHEMGVWKVVSEDQPCGIRNMGWSMTNSKRSGRDDTDHLGKEPWSREGIDIPFGPPSEEYFYRCPVCGTEDLVNEAIIDVAVGAAKFRGEYQGGMPKLGCPGCNGETMEYVDQE